MKSLGNEILLNRSICDCIFQIQYVYIHQCIMALLEGDDENAYENYNGTTDPYYQEALI